MAIFVEFYTTMLGFVNFRLYHNLNLQYPPALPHHQAQPDGAGDSKQGDESFLDRQGRLKLSISIHEKVFSRAFNGLTELRLNRLKCLFNR